MIIPGIVLVADVVLAGVLIFIFRASSSGLDAADVVLTLLPGLGSRLITGMTPLDDVGRGVARRLLRVVVVEVEMVEEDEGAGWVDMVARGAAGFSGSGANQKLRQTGVLTAISRLLLLCKVKQ